MPKSQISGAGTGGTTPAPTSTQTPRDPFAKGRRGPNITLSELDPQDLQWTLDLVLDTGALLSIGRTSDGGAIGVYLTQDGHRFKEWASSPEELEAIFVELADWGRSLA